MKIDIYNEFISDGFITIDCEPSDLIVNIKVMI